MTDSSSPENRAWAAARAHATDNANGNNGLVLLTDAQDGYFNPVHAVYKEKPDADDIAVLQSIEPGADGEAKVQAYAGRRFDAICKPVPAAQEAVAQSAEATAASAQADIDALDQERDRLPRLVDEPDPNPSIKRGPKRLLAVVLGLGALAIAAVGVVNAARFATTLTQDWSLAFLAASPILFALFTAHLMVARAHGRAQQALEWLLRLAFGLSLAGFVLSFAWWFARPEPTIAELVHGRYTPAWVPVTQLISQMFLEFTAATALLLEIGHLIIAPSRKLINPDWECTGAAKSARERLRDAARQRAAVARDRAKNYGDHRGLFIDRCVAAWRTLKEEESAHERAELELRQMETTRRERRADIIRQLAN